MGRKFFQRYTPTVAKELIGSLLVRRIDGETLSGVIVETEAYRGREDPASHAYRGKTPRNEVMFGPPGHAYVYFTMGMHYCLNVTTEPVGNAAAVLLRAIEPAKGMGLMSKNRGIADVQRLASGPGNLTKAMAIDRSLNGEDLVTSDRLFLESGRPEASILATSRVGVSAGRSNPWRFFLEGSRFVSRARPAAAPRTHN
ncbi:MAG: DNA-3-methyladenine glycosylase [Nitrososphaerota archaeon]|nr:DNA-3-methyladenine glycosylase [Nitrososphaerota archaeon]